MSGLILVLLYPILSIPVCEAGGLQFPSPGITEARLTVEHQGPQGSTGKSSIRISHQGQGLVWEEVATNGNNKQFASLNLIWNLQGDLLNASWKDGRTDLQGQCQPEGAVLKMSTQQGDWKTLYQTEPDEIPFPLLKLALQNRFAELSPGQPFGMKLVIPELALQLQKQGLPETWMRIKLKGRLGAVETFLVGSQAITGRWVELTPADSLMQSLLPETYRSIRFLMQEAPPHWPLVMIQGKQEYRLVQLDLGPPKTPASP